MRNDTERELLFSQSPRAVWCGVHHEGALVGPHCSLLCVCLCVCPSAVSPCWAQPVLSCLCEGAHSDPAVQLTLLKQCIDLGGLVYDTEAGGELCNIDRSI